MNTKHVLRGIRTRFAQPSMALMLVGMLLGSAGPALAETTAGAPNCAEAYDPAAVYPTLPAVDGPDISGEAGVVIYLHEDHAVVELDGCFFVADRPLEVDFAGLDVITLLVELPDHPDGGKIHVSQDNAWVETLDVDGPMFSHAMSSEHALGFELAAPGSTAPTGPVIVTKPSGGNPDPK